MLQEVPERPRSFGGPLDTETVHTLNVFSLTCLWRDSDSCTRWCARWADLKHQARVTHSPCGGQCCHQLFEPNESGALVLGNRVCYTVPHQQNTEHPLPSPHSTGRVCCTISLWPLRNTSHSTGHQVYYTVPDLPLWNTPPMDMEQGCCHIRCHIYCVYCRIFKPSISVCFSWSFPFVAPHSIP